MFDLIGETLRRLRKDRGLTLEELGRMAELGRGQLSRIENSRQEATLSTLAKILASQGVSRRDFFHRYDLVESEALAVQRQETGEGAADGNGLKAPRPVMDGAIEFGDLKILFQVVPKDAGPTPETPPKPKREPAGVPREQGPKPGRKRKR